MKKRNAFLTVIIAIIVLTLLLNSKLNPKNKQPHTPNSYYKNAAKNIRHEFNKLPYEWPEKDERINKGIELLFDKENKNKAVILRSFIATETKNPKCPKLNIEFIDKYRNVTEIAYSASPNTEAAIMKKEKLWPTYDFHKGIVFLAIPFWSSQVGDYGCPEELDSLCFLSLEEYEILLSGKGKILLYQEDKILDVIEISYITEAMPEIFFD